MIDRRLAAAVLAMLAPFAVADVPAVDLGRFPVALAAPSGRWSIQRFLALPSAGSAKGPLAFTCAGAGGCSGEVRLDDGTTRVTVAFERRPAVSWHVRVVDVPSGRVVATVEQAPVDVGSLSLSWSASDGLAVARGGEAPFRVGPAGFVPRRLEIAVEGGRLGIDSLEIAASQVVQR